jgi:hypothetical protein
MKMIKKKYIQQDTSIIEESNVESYSKYIRTITYWVGSFVIEFNSFENSITEILGWRINGADIRGYEHIFISGLTYNQKVELLQRLYRYSISFVNSENDQNALKKKSDELIAELRDIGKIRNAIVHSDYHSYDENGNVKEKIRFAESGAEEHWTAITRDFIVENINRMFDFMEKIEEFNTKLEF